jgi:hypothetical protein
MFTITATKIISLSTIVTTSLAFTTPFPVLARNLEGNPNLAQSNSHFQALTPTQLFKEPTLIAQGTSQTQPTNRNLTLIPAAPNQSQDAMYKRLEDFLAKQDFKNADQQTWELMKQAGNGGKEIYLISDQVNNFSCSALKKIDNLWAKYSQGKFGFSVQKNIWLSVGGNPNADLETYRRFAIKVGWGTRTEDFDYDNLNFSGSAKRGHLPVWGVGLRWVGGFRFFFSRVANGKV